MKDLIIVRDIYINLRQDHAKLSGCLGTQVANQFLHKLPKYSDNIYFFLHPQN